ncbi:MAG: sugar transferase [Rhodothermaceae bacterium]|nr:sugar transferase [Rhodothermaceae bacterium]MXW31553.1 sugar transferase [Rhodothermaceae bacterium]MXX97186.1 sugar transferase [Rhodothermaceae bacterium]MXZ58449.1 sugar transferase [Rhodothermaceae bacterium]MYB90089.1 sugar transferase [Rhodothermaceae bacterium]
MSRKLEFIALLITDIVATVASCILYLRIRFPDSFAILGFEGSEGQMIYPLYASLALALFWIVMLLFAGMYRERHAASRIDEIVSLAKVITVGVLILVFSIFIDELDTRGSLSIFAIYWASVLGTVTFGRVLVRSVQKALILRGYGMHRALVVGWRDQVERLYRDVAKYPAAGLQIVGAVRLGQQDNGTFNGSETEDGETVHAVERLPDMIDDLQVRDVLIALGSQDHKELAEVLRLCDGKNVALKIVPDFYSVIGGMARTEHIYGLPLIEVLATPMPAWEQYTKRLIDLIVALVILVVGMPLWIGLAIAVKVTSKGGAIYRQKRVGKKGRVFTMYKFRTMQVDAEAKTGPVWASKDDSRYTSVGRWLRKTRLDEIPQLWNVLRGNMSLVGPRPERPYFVEKLIGKVPLYNRRHRVKPGITGWAQVMWHYDSSLEDVQQKVKFDLYYIENMSLRMDLKILFRTLRAVVSGGGH